MQANWDKLAVLAFYLVFLADQAFSLECYVCRNQTNNKDKCVETVKNCDIGEDRCMAEVRWGSTPYWAPSGQKQYYISKTCASKEICELKHRQYLRRCDRIWYNDWECAECCTGDRCNYYVTLGTEKSQPSILSIIIATFVALTIIR